MKPRIANTYGGGPDSEFVTIINSAYQPFATLAVASAELARAYPFYKEYSREYAAQTAKSAVKPAVYICEGTRCEQPITTAEKLREKLL